jgi:prepilin-type N-terminal cleavage/methylation domain-containing protein
MKIPQKGGGFTLVEVLVVITILAVLWTIAFLSFSHYSGSARDTTRKTDASNINKILELYKVWKWVYAEPTNAHKVVVWSTPIWTQWVFWTGSQREIGKILWSLQDPRFENNYAYSTTNSKTEYQLWVIYEREWISEDIPNLTFNPIQEAHAADIAPTPVNTDANLSFWFDGQDVDNDWKNDANDSVIANIWVTKNVVPIEFDPFYFNRVIWLDGQDINGDLQPDEFNDWDEITTWVNKTWAWFNGFVPQTWNNHTNPSASSAPNFEEDAFWAWKDGVYFNGISKWDRIVVDRGTQPKGSPFSIAYTFKVNDADWNSAENVWTSHATIISVWPSWWWAYHPLPGAWQLSRDGRLNNFIFRITWSIPEANKQYFNGADCLNDSGNNSCEVSWSAEIAFWDWSEINDNQDHTVFVTFDGSKVTWYLDGTKRFEATMENTDPYGEYFRFYGNRAWTSYLEWVIWEVFIADEKISLQDLEKIEWYFSNKWGYALSSDHPYFWVATVEMDESSELEYTRFEWNIPDRDNFDLQSYLVTNPSILDSELVRIPGALNGINIEEDYKTHIWRGLMKVSETWNYTFQTASDDYSFVQIADAENPSSSFVTIVDNWGYHGVRTENGTINLIADHTYEFILAYGEASGWAALDFRVDGPWVISYRQYVSDGWLDKSPSSKDLVQPVKLNAPSYNPLNASMQFEPSTYFEFPSGNEPYGTNDNWHVFAVVEIESSSEEAVWGLIFENDSSTDTGTLSFWTRWIQAWTQDYSSSDVTGKQFQIISYEFDQWGDIQKYFVWWQQFLNESSDISNIDGDFYIGWKSIWFTWEIREIIWYKDVFTDTAREDIEGYLAQKWGLSHKLKIDHTYYEPLETGEELYVEVTGNYNGVLAHWNIWDSHIVVATPSIISSEYVEPWQTVSFSSLTGWNKLVYNGFRNIPASYLGVDEVSEELTSKDGFFFNYNNTTVFEWSKEELASYRWISEIDDGLRLIYTNSYLHEFVSDKFDNNDTAYIKNILWDIIGINPIVPFYCKDILDSSRWTNVALTATLDWNAGFEESDWLQTITDNIITPEGSDYSYLTNPGAATDKSISLFWEDGIEDVSLIVVHNAFWSYSKNLRYATLKIINEFDEQVYTYAFGDTNWESEISIEPIISQAWKIREIIITPQEFDRVWLREIQVFTGEKSLSGTYKVDDDGIWGKQSYEVYCDMVTDGWGWTKVWNNYVYNWAFTEWQHVENWDGVYSSFMNIVSASNPWSSDHVLRQSSAIATTSTVAYRIDVDNLEAMKAGRELRFKAWVRYDWGTVGSVNPFEYFMSYEWGGIETGWIPKTVATEVIWGDTWELKEMTINLEKDVSDFYWRAGYDVEKSPSKVLYMADLRLEIYFQ